jgi:DNA-directed RNA polymerase specialized sigma24 family protein
VAGGRAIITQPQAQRNEQMLRAADALMTLPEAQWEALVLHYWQEKPVVEIS